MSGGVPCLAMRPGSLELEEGTWYPANLDAARERIVEAARRVIEHPGELYEIDRLAAALAAYDALLAAKGGA